MLLLQKGGDMQNFRSELHRFSQVIEKKKKNCTIKVKSNGKNGSIYFKTGKLVNAKTDTLGGKSALLEILSWEGVTWKSKWRCKEAVEVITTPLPQIMVESIERCLKTSRAVTPGKPTPQPNKQNPPTEEDCLLPQESYQEPPDPLPAATHAENWQAEPDTQNWKVEPETEELNDYDTSNNFEKEDDMLNSQQSLGRARQTEPLSRIDRLNMILADLKALSGAIEACAVVSEDGLIMASNLPTGMEEDSVAAMSAVMLSMGERTAAELDRGTADLLFIRGDAGYVVTTRAGANAVLVVTARQEAKLGLIFLDLSRAAKSIAEILI